MEPELNFKLILQITEITGCQSGLLLSGARGQE